MKKKSSGFKWKGFSTKQKKVLTWWTDESPYSDKDGIIADGAVRAGKTIIMSFSYILWAMSNYNSEVFGMAGKTISSSRRNVLFFLKLILMARGYKVRDKRSDNLIIISKGGVENYFYIFGGKDEASQDLVQGLTCAGFFFDEVTLMPESFVNQAVARCSVEGAKLWFNCNPDGPFHWFNVNWVLQASIKNMLRIHFVMDDNPSLSESTKEKYRRRFSGIFYERFILGLWVLADGIIYSMFNRSMVVKRVPAGVKINRKWIGIDYGQSNATVFILVGQGSDNKMYILDEYYHSGRESIIQKSPRTYAKEFRQWKLKNGGKVVNALDELEHVPVRTQGTYIDPSAKGFMLQLHEEGERDLKQADNDVLRGIQLLASIIESDNFRVLEHCTNTINELSTYRWDTKKAKEKGEDVPIKQNDHLMDALRYVVNGNRKIWQRVVGGE